MAIIKFSLHSLILFLFSRLLSIEEMALRIPCSEADKKSPLSERSDRATAGVGDFPRNGMEFSQFLKGLDLLAAAERLLLGQAKSKSEPLRLIQFSENDGLIVRPKWVTL